MTLAVCIPVYNQDVTSLVYTLLKQTKTSNGRVNIIILDDHSDDAFQSMNRVLSAEVKYIYLDKNVGRSKIRNEFLNHTDAEYLLFLDCDSTIVDDQFISSYQKYIERERPDVIVGSSIYQNNPPKIEHRLRWKYGTNRESESHETRSLKPNTSFKTNNFIISQECFKETLFHEELTGYGHEDTLFGYDLNKKNVQIQHIDNPVLNGQLDTNKEFMIKTEEGLGNLLKVWRIVNHDPLLADKVKIIKYLNKYKNSFWFKSVYWLTKKPIRYFLCLGCANLFLFDFYKLGYLIQLESQNN